MALSYMPISLAMKGRTCLVVGGGNVALRKVETLLDYDTDITVIAPEVDNKLKAFAERGKIKLEQRPYRSPEAAAFQLVISACDDMDVNRRVHDDAHGAGVLVNVADQPALCDFIFPAVLRRDCLTAAISTDGQAPFLSGHLKLVLDNVFPPHWNKLMKHAVKFRKMAMERWANDPVQKTAAYTAFLEADWKTLLKEKEEGEIDMELKRLLEPVAAPAGEPEPPSEG